MDMTEFQQFTDAEDDYQLQDFFPKAVPYALNPTDRVKHKTYSEGDHSFHARRNSVSNQEGILTETIVEE